MFGQNPIRSITQDPNKIEVESHFFTIQGEGPYSGMPALFIRLSGCNLACHFCDTQFEKNAGVFRDVQEVADEIILTYPANQREFVVITGGEPMRQDFSLLAQLLLTSGTRLIQVETAGTLWQPALAPRLMVGDIVLVCSPKTPQVHVMVASYCNHWKYIIRESELSQDDGLPMYGTNENTKFKKQLLYRASKSKPGTVIWVSPCDEYDAFVNESNTRAAVESAMKFGYRLSLQVHKLVNVE